MALKSISFATLLQMGGDRGGGGDIVCKAIAHAGLDVPKDVDTLFPPNVGHCGSGEVANEGGNTQIQYPCGFQDGDPTVVTVPTDLEQHSLDSLGAPRIRSELAATYHAHHFNCPTCVAAGRGARYGQRCSVGIALWNWCVDIADQTVREPEIDSK